MLLAIYILVIALTAHLVMFWKGLHERSCRWELYALRDELRRVAIENALLDSPLFERVDRSLTGLAANLHDVSLWSMLPQFVAEQNTPEYKRYEREIALLIARPENKLLAVIMWKAVSLLLRHLACRHMFLSATLFLTWTVRDSMRRLSTDVVTGATVPPMKHPVIINQPLAA